MNNATATIHTTVNGAALSLDADPATPAVYILRNELGLMGVRFGCGEGHCGACMILLDGIPTRSCELPAEAMAHHSVTTAEGLGTREQPHPLQLAVLDEQAGQCGYCLNGMIVSASAMKPGSRSEQNILKTLDNHLCRCGSHRRIVKAVARAFAQESANDAC